MICQLAAALEIVVTLVRACRLRHRHQFVNPHADSTADRPSTLHATAWLPLSVWVSDRPHDDSETADMPRLHTKADRHARQHRRRPEQGHLRIGQTKLRQYALLPAGPSCLAARISTTRHTALHYPRNSSGISTASWGSSPPRTGSNSCVLDPNWMTVAASAPTCRF